MPGGCFNRLSVSVYYLTERKKTTIPRKKNIQSSHAILKRQKAIVKICVRLRIEHILAKKFDLENKRASVVSRITAPETSVQNVKCSIQFRVQTIWIGRTFLKNDWACVTKERKKWNDTLLWFIGYDLAWHSCHWPHIAFTFEPKKYHFISHRYHSFFSSSFLSIEI